MPTTIVKPVTVHTFKPFSKLGKSNGRIQSRICDLLFRLIQTDDPSKVREICKEEIAWLESLDYSAGTRAAYVSAYRKSLSAWFAEHPGSESVTVTRQTSKGAIAQHCSLDFLLAAPSDYAHGQQKTKTKTAAQRDNLTGFDAAAAVEATEEALQSSDWRKLAAGLIMATQSRPSDMLSTGEFKATTKYRLEFSSRAKKRGAIATGEIFCLVDTTTFIDAFSRLRREADVIEMRGWSLKDIDSAKNSTLNRAVKRVYGESISVPYGEKELSCKNLRAAGVNAAYWLHGRDEQSLGRFAELQLLHDNPGTAANYEDFYAADADGKRLLQVGILKDEPLTATPKSEKRSSVSVDAQLRDMIGDAERWGEGSHADRLERIIARAEQANKLERQLARECEKRQKAELDLKRVESAIADTEFVPLTEVSLPPDVSNSAEVEPTGFDWRAVPNEVLKDDLRNDAYREKLRRSVEAIQEYNAGRELSDQYKINSSVLRELAGVSPKRVTPWMDECKAEIDAYSAAQGHTYQQNKGKAEARSVMKWSEAAYGAYGW